MSLSHPVAGQGEKEADDLSLYPTAPRCSVSYSVHPQIPQTTSISRILSLTSTSYTFHRYIFHCLPTENAPLYLPTYPHENYTVGVDILIPFPFCSYCGYFYFLNLKFLCLEQKPCLHFAGPCWHFASFSYNTEHSNSKPSKNKATRSSLAERNLRQAMDFPKQPHVFHTACSYSRRKQIKQKQKLTVKLF